MATPLTGQELVDAIRRVRLLLNDTSTVEDRVFSDADLTDFLTLEGWVVKLAAASAIDTNASNEALASKVLRTKDVDVDGAKLADALRKHAASLREQAYDELEDSEDGFFFGVVDFGPSDDHVERTQYPC